MDNKGMDYRETRSQSADLYMNRQASEQMTPIPQDIALQNVGTIPIVDTSPRWSWCTLITSIFGCFLCTCCGLPGMVLAILSYVDHKNKDFAMSAQKRAVALGLGIAAIVVGSIVIITIISLYSYLTVLALRTLSQVSYEG